MKKAFMLMRLSFLLVLLAGTVALCMQSKGWADVLIDDFHDGGLNELGGFTGSFSGGDGSAVCVDTLSDGGLRLSFSRTPGEESFCGFYSILGPDQDTVDTVFEDVNQLTFSVRGDIRDNVPGAGHNFQIEIKDNEGRRLVTALRNVPGLEAGTEEGLFREVNIPFSAMWPDAGPVNFSAVREIAIAFNREFTEPSAPGTSNELVIDDLKFTRRPDPPENILVPDPTDPEIDLIATAPFIATGPSPSQFMTVAEDLASLRGTSLKLYHDLSESGDFFAFFAFPRENPLDLASAGVKTVKIRLRKTGVDAAPSKAVVELKRMGAVVGTVLVNDIGTGTDDTDYAETVFPIYSDSPAIDEVVLVFFDGARGAFHMDRLSLSTDPYVPHDPVFQPSAGPERTDSEVLDFVESETARYFVNQVVGSSYFVRDRSADDSASSIAATAFGLSAYTVIAERFNPAPGTPWHIVSNGGTLITPLEAEARVSRLLDEFLAIQAAQPDQATGEGDPDRLFGIAGFFYHFLNGDGTRSEDSEVSVIDTAILLTAAIQAGEYFGGAVKTKAAALLDNVDWNFMFLSGDRAFRLSWLPDRRRGFNVVDPAGIGFLSDGTIGRPTDELLLVNFMALMSDPENESFREALFSYPRVERVYASPSAGDIPVVNSFFGSAFTYLYAQLYLDFESLGQDRPDLVDGVLTYPVPVDWWANAVSAFRANRQFAIDRSVFFPFSFHSASWGISAVERPDGRYEGLYGAPPAENGPTHDGTVATHISFSSLPFFKTSDNELLSANTGFQAIRFAYDNMFDDLFGENGPVDSYNDRAEFSAVTLGLDQGPIVLSIENYRSRLLLDTFMQNDRVKAAAEIAFGHVPEFQDVGVQTAEVGAEFTLELVAADEDGDGGIVISSDNLPDGSTLTAVSEAHAVFRWTPGASDIGSRIVSFNVRDEYRENPEPLFVTIDVHASTAPSAFFVSPDSGTPLSGTVHIDARSTDPDHTQYGFLYLDNRLMAWTYGGILTYDLETAFFENGPHEIHARFYHSLSGSYLDATGTFTFDNAEIIPRSISIASPADGATLTGNVQVAVDVNDPEQTFYYQLYVDGVRTAVSYYAPGPFNINTAAFGNGVHTIRVRAYNKFLRSFIEDEIQATFANNVPDFMITAPAHGETVSGVIDIVVDDDAGDRNFYGRLFVDGLFRRWDFFSPFRFRLDTRMLSNGAHTLRVSAYSLARRTFLEHQINIVVEN